jgi:hypothetical protein
VLAGGRLAVPAVHQVEQPTTDDNDGEVSVLGANEVGRRLRSPTLAVAAFEGPADVSVAVPVEECPTPSLSSAMKPSSETTAPMTVFPIPISVHRSD